MLRETPHETQLPLLARAVSGQLGRVPALESPFNQAEMYRAQRKIDGLLNQTVQSVPKLVRSAFRARETQGDTASYHKVRGQTLEAGLGL
ncbi:unnamed protein product [Boreogadus saida]